MHTIVLEKNIKQTLARKKILKANKTFVPKLFLHMSKNFSRILQVLPLLMQKLSSKKPIIQQQKIKLRRSTPV